MSLAGEIANWCLLFFIYSAAGWCVEVALGATLQQKMVNRGFLIGPVCPIYGFGAVIMSLVAGRGESILEIFLISFLAGAVLEYSTSYFMEKLFRVRWWDYHDEKLNLHGRICLKYLICFGVGGVLIIKFINPILLGLFNAIGVVPRMVIAAVLVGLLLADLGVSLWLIIKCRVTVGTVNADATEEITQHVRQALMEKGKLDRRLAKAFPDMHIDQDQAAQAKIKTQAKAQVRAIKKSAKVQTRAVKTRAKADTKAISKTRKTTRKNLHND